jgi:hypothetical protein
MSNIIRKENAKISERHKGDISLDSCVRVQRNPASLGNLTVVLLCPSSDIIYILPHMYSSFSALTPIPLTYGQVVNAATRFSAGLA